MKWLRVSKILEDKKEIKKMAIFKEKTIEEHITSICENCKDDFVNNHLLKIAIVFSICSNGSIDQPITQSNSYECLACGNVFEIFIENLL